MSNAAHPITILALAVQDPSAATDERSGRRNASFLETLLATFSLVGRSFSMAYADPFTPSRPRRD